MKWASDKKGFRFGQTKVPLQAEIQDKAGNADTSDIVYLHFHL